MADKTPRHIAALELAKRGIPVFPVQVDGKLPLPGSNGFKDATTDLDQINRWWGEADYNLAIEPEKAGWAVVDVEANGAAEWTALCEASDMSDWQINTRTIRTRSGGWHYYFRGSCPSSVKRLAEHIDTRGRGGYVLVPPSMVGGKPYYVERECEPEPLPEFVNAKLAERKHEAKAATVETIDPEVAFNRGVDIIDNEIAKGEVYEGTRDNTAFRVACWLKDVGCDEDQSFALMHDLWNSHVHPPLDDDVLRQKIESASRNSQNERGAQAAARASDAFKDVVIDSATPEPTRRLPEPRKLSELTGDDEPVGMVVEHWIQKGKINIFRGAGGSNKSRLGLQWAMQCDAGKDAAGFKVEKCSALYISCEDDQPEVKRRKNAIAKKLSIKDSGVLYFDMTDEDDAFMCSATDTGGVVRTSLWDDIEKRMRAIPGHKLLILDSTYDVIDFQGSTKNSDTHVRIIIRLFDRLCRRADCTIICLWHPSRAGMARGDEGGFATAWDNAPRNAIAIKALEDDDQFELSAKKRNNMPKGKPVILRWIEGTLQVATDDDATMIYEHGVVVDAAIEAAKQGSPIQHNRKPMGWVFDFIKEQTGHTMKLQDIRDILARETRRDNARIMYRHTIHGRSSKEGPSGYVPKPVTKEDWET